MQASRFRSYLMLIVVAVIWGAAIPVIKYTLSAFPPVLFLTYRFGISTIIAIIIFSLNGIHLPRSKGTVLLIFLYGFLNSVVSLGLLFFGMENTTALEAGLITITAPLIISTVGVYFLHEHVTLREKIGISIAMIGTVLTIFGPLLLNGHSLIKFSGNILVFGYVLSTVVTTVIVKKLLKNGVNPLTMTNISFIIGFICFLTYTLYTNSLLESLNLIKHIPLTYHIGVWYMAVLSGSLAFYLNNKAQKSIEIGEQSLFTYLDPIFALPFAVLWLGEKITSAYLIGGIIIVTGVVIAEIKKRRYNTTSRK